MPVHVHLKNNRSASLFTITDTLLNALTPSFEIFEKRTGVFIDPYGDTRLTYQHAAVLTQIITDEISNKRLLPQKAITDFTAIIEKLINEQTDVVLIGD